MFRHDEGYFLQRLRVLAGAAGRLLPDFAAIQDTRHKTYWNSSYFPT
jgi:hypothetical protein